MIYKNLLTMVAALGILTSAVCINESNAAENKPVIKIGATLPLTGDSAEAGLAAKAGLEIVLADLQKNNLRYDYQLVFEDNQLSSPKVYSSVNKMINADKVKALLSFWNLSGNVVSSVADKEGVFSLTCSIGEESTKGRYNFNNYVSNPREAEAMVETLKKHGVKTVALITDNSGMRQQYEVVKDYMAKNSDIKVVFEEFFNPGETDYKAAIIKASEKKPDMYLYSGYNPSIYIFMKQLKEITGKNDNVTTIDMFFDMAPKDRDIVEGLWYVDSNLNGTPEFQKRLLDEKGVVSQSCTGNVAGNLQIIVAAYENAELKEGETIPSNEAVRQWIFDNIHDYKTVGGEVTVVREGLFDKAPSIKKMVNREAVIAE